MIINIKISGESQRILQGLSADTIDRLVNESVRKACERVVDDIMSKRIGGERGPVGSVKLPQFRKIKGVHHETRL